MELIQSSFQASFDARVERVNAVELAELRTIFRFFDTDSDGAVSADQACRMFALLGLDVNPMFVQDLEEVYLNEFLKIVDSHMPEPPPPPTAVDSVGAENGDLSTADSLQASASPVIPVLQIADPATGTSAALAANASAPPAGHQLVGSEAIDPADQLVLDEEELRKRNEQLWGDEWKLIDSYHRGFVSLHELRLFLANCGSAIPACDLLRFVEVYGESAAATATRYGEPEGDVDQDASGDDVFVLTRAGFIKFRREYTERDMQDSNDGRSSDEDDEDDDDAENKTLMHHEPSADEGEGDGSKSTSSRRRRQSQQKSDDGVSSISSSRRHTLIVVDPGVLDASHFDVEEEDEDEGEDGDVVSQLSGGNSSKSSVSFQYNDADAFSKE